MLDPSVVWQALSCLPLLLLPVIHIISCTKSRRPRGDPVSLRSKVAPSCSKGDSNLDVCNEQRHSSDPTSLDAREGVVLPLTGRDEGGADGNGNPTTFLDMKRDEHIKIFEYLSPEDRLRARVTRYLSQLEAGWKNKVDTLLITDDAALVARRQCVHYTNMLLNNNNGKTYLDYVAGLEKLRKNSKFNSIILKVSDTQWIGQLGDYAHGERKYGNELMWAIYDTEAPRLVVDIKDKDRRRDWLTTQFITGLCCGPSEGNGREEVALARAIPMLNDYRALDNLHSMYEKFISGYLPKLRSLHFDVVPTREAEALLGHLNMDRRDGWAYTVPSKSRGSREIEAHTKGNAVIVFERSNDEVSQGIFGIHRVNEDGTLPMIPLDAMGRRGELDLE